jgi:twinkle protein
MHDDSTFLHHEPCPSCGSSDALARFSDGHGFCFACEVYQPADGEQHQPAERTTMPSDLIPPGDPIALSKRRLSEATCEKWGYTTTAYKGKPVQVANYRDERGRIVAQKVRFANKDFVFLGDGKKAGLYGQHLWRDHGKMVVITEGEIDALSVSQAQGNKYPVVSVPKGAKGAAKAIAQSIEWLENFESVIFMFDMDEPGREAAEACAALLPPGKAKIASLPLKDANEMLVAGRIKEIIDAIWGAKEWRPDGLVGLADIREEVLRPVEWGLPWPWETLTKLTYGRRRGEVYTLGAGTGIGKTDVFTQMIAQTVTELKLPVGVFYLEQPPIETARRIAGKVAGQRFHVPDAGWTTEQLVATIDALAKDNLIQMYNHFGSTDWNVIKSRIRYLVQAHGVKDIFLDHLTALAAHATDEKVALEKLMAEIAGLCQELSCTVYMISHLATPEGKPHEEGGRVMIRHFKGSRSIGFWSHFMFGLERDQQAEDEKVRQTTVFRVLKDRYTGQATGQVFYLGYEHETGRLYETTNPETHQDDSKGFEPVEPPPGDYGQGDF